MTILEELKQRLVEENEALEAIRSSITGQAQTQLWLKTLLSKKQTEKEIFQAFEDNQESHAEALITGEPTVTTDLVKPRSFKDILAAKRLVDQARMDNLSGEIIPASSTEPTDPSAITAIYEIPEVEIEEADPEADRLADLETAEALEEELQAKENTGTQESFSLSVILNEQQLAAKDMAYAGKSFCLTGAAGTGKTTAQRAIAEALLLDKRLSTSSFKTYSATGERQYTSAPSIAFVAFTRRAASNLAKAILKSPVLEEQLKNNIMTIHALLEFEPETYIDFSEGFAKEKFRFAPKRHAQNPLNITHLIIEESSMLDAMTLWGYLYDALPAGVQIIFIGDINQLPPVFGPSILNYALVQLPVIELKKVYRNQGIVLENAHRILKGETLLENNKFVIVRGKAPVQVGQEKLSAMLGSLFNQWLDIKGDDGLPEYDPNDCMILSPFNKQPCGTDTLNAWIAQHLGKRRNAIIHEVIAGFNKLYLAKGDRVMVNKMDGIIEDIFRNPAYHGKEPQVAGSDLTRFGVRTLGESGKDSLDDIALDYSNFSLEALEAEKAERKMQCSHCVRVLLENGKEEELSAAGDFGPQSFSLGYALTVHKAQGSEWRKVFLILHKDHAVMLYREHFYTAVTRARTKVTIISKDATINKAIKNQRIKGDTIADKIEFFNKDLNVNEEIYATK